MPHDYAIKITVRNNRLLEKMRLAGFETAVSLSRASGVSESTIGSYLGMKKAPLMRRKGEPWSPQALKLATYLRCLPEDLFPVAQLRVGMEKNYAEFTVDAADIHQISASLRSMALPADEKMMAIESKQVLSKLLHGILPREERVLRMRFGFDDGREHSLDEIGKEYGVTAERIRGIESKAIKKLKKAVFADKSIQAEFGRQLSRSALNLVDGHYTPPHKSPAPVSEASEPSISLPERVERAASVRELLEKYLGGPGGGSSNPYALSQ